ncbi:MAG: glycoside hydrolase family 20 zincin-like fold domain-containing protein [Planctomycetota bacterium]
MERQLVLLPTPRKMARTGGEFALPGGRFVRLATEPQAIRQAGLSVQAALQQATGQTIELWAGGADAAVTLAVDSRAAKPQGYVLEVKPGGVLIRGHDAAGVFYGAQTLAQLVRQAPARLPGLRIEDWPDFPARGVMLDISRDKVPTLATLYALVDLLAEWKINQLQLYTEHTFAYRAHPEVWAEASPMTGDDILALDAYCRARCIALVPNQNSFAHMDRWVKLERYRPLAEAPDGFDFPWGGHSGTGFTLCPGDPRSLALLKGLYDELLPHFSSRLFNVGCDETFELGLGRSKEACAKRGKERVYLDFLLKIQRLVQSHGRTMQFWGDIILHKPELIRELPKGLIALEWGYEADHPFDKDGRLFHNAGVPFYVCPGTSSWNTLAGRTANATGNLRSAAANGLKHGAIGYLNTDWGDSGHLQYLPISYLGFAAGAACSWCQGSNEKLDLPTALDRHAFHDSAGVMGRLAYDLGNTYLAGKKQVGNSTVLFHILVLMGADLKSLDGVSRAELEAQLAAIDKALSPLGRARMARPDAALIADEFRNAAAMMRQACCYGLACLESRAPRCPELAPELRRIAGEHRRLWLARNRPGGLADSARRLEKRLETMTS